MVKKLLQNSVVFMALVIILLLIIPLPPALIDVAILLNMALSMMILVITMTIHDPLEFSIFPSMLMLTTLFSLGINVSTTRSILSSGGSAGHIVAAFGDFILQSNVVVGLVIYLIIVLMNFLVINRGAERVAEVAARFSLDAMPGKQMAIDADLNSGMIDDQEAARRRDKVQRESDFYGSMDGATKIVKGNSTMSLITTAINLVGGIIIGMVQGGGDLATVAQTYSIATVGDGLVGQIPSLLISTATGMIVTRATARGSLNEDIAGEFKAQPRAFTISGIVVAVLALIPGMPIVQILIVSGILIASGYYLNRQMEAQPRIGRDMNSYQTGTLKNTKKAGPEQPADAQPEGKPQEKEQTGAPAQEGDYFKDVNNIYQLLTVEPIELDFGYSLIPLADESVGGRLISRIVIFRRQYAQDMGFVVPSIRLRDSSAIGTNEYVIRIRGEEIARGEILTDYFLALEPEHVEREIEGIEAIEPSYGIPSRWIRPENREKAELYGYTVIDPLSVLVNHLSEVIRQHSFELMTRQEVVRLADNLKKTAPELVSEVFPQVISYNLLQKILTQLLEEGIAIRDLETIVETVSASLSDTSSPAKDIDSIVSNVRVALKRTITRMYAEDGNLRVYTLDADLERTMAASLTRGEGGNYLALPPDVLQSVVLQVADVVKKFQSLSQTPVILTSQVMRTHFYHLISQFYPTVRVLAFNEIVNNVQIQSLGSLKLERQTKKS
ncbi:MAG: flagellar biosynthesis protein FlhA [Lachnospiraceae bacterium]|jgi:flagellar biosynthesis protein FlhA|nr:flagellar biosynthesis protein FlhA [Lachnospiraceae bacterium]MCH4028471.1 flagellar biosynthesis protein FlhA [Lachnospiraceae bacterium]MCH4066321.1 flagellar biosynthesis protein FlhA [Lachnospiraceae bacterium]MCH4112351.1 flagellar biosynthesis protein FlhA [Lachnospiraceae bacterium]MCI1353330.1 flagellar biosynthesis protein FlhA [Lachnospiraceae bacterium]